MGINTGCLARDQTWFLAIEQHRQRRDGNSEPKIHGKHKPAIGSTGCVPGDLWAVSAD